MHAPLLLAIAILVQAPSFSPIQDGDAHGDPPHLLEDGWERLLDGPALSGWPRCGDKATSD